MNSKEQVEQARAKEKKLKAELRAMYLEEEKLEKENNQVKLSELRRKMDAVISQIAGLQIVKSQMRTS